jgi:hypothetical protein
MEELIYIQTARKTPSIHGGERRAFLVWSRVGWVSLLDVYTITCYNVNMQQKRAYKYRVYPTNEQKHILARTFG